LQEVLEVAPYPFRDVDALGERALQCRAMAHDWRPWRAYYDQLGKAVNALGMVAAAIDEIPGEAGSNARRMLGAVLELVELERRRAAGRSSF
jgi:hypothetical protein